VCYEKCVAVDDGGSTQRIRVWRQVVLGLALFGVYLLVDRPGVTRQATADRHGRDLYALEQRLHLDVERPLNDWLAPHKVLSTLANYGYAFSYILSAFALLVWILVRRPDAFRHARDSFVVLNVIAIACFVLYPVTPPRLLPELGLVDTVAQGNAWWSELVDHANQLAAMPSLHVSWAVWVSMVLFRLGRAWVQVVSGIHVIVTVLVVFATANHYVPDVVAAVVLVAVSVVMANAWHDRAARPGVVVPSHDAFFLHVETAAAPQHVGGLVVFEPSDGDALSVERVTELVKGELDRLPRFRQRLGPAWRWRRQRWIDVAEIDWPLHISDRHSADGPAGLRRIVAELAETPMARDRPMWRIVMVREVAPGVSAMILLLHHAVADGIGTVIQALNLLRPRIELLGVRGPAPRRAQLLGATITGLAQLATDGGAGAHLDCTSTRREFATADLELAAVRRAASSRGVRVTDLVLGLIADAVAATHPDVATRLRGRMRVAVPLMVRDPGAAAETNATAAVMVDVPLDGRPFEELLAEISRRTARLRTPSRAVASRFVMATGLRALPEPSAGWFARTVYGRRFFHAIVSNMPGSTQSLSMDGVTIASVYPILPLAPGSPLAVGALSWAGSLGIGLATDPAVLDAGVLAARIEQVLGVSPERPHEHEEESRA
jgi:diacylglycerol O-acyltransferase